MRKRRAVLGQAAGVLLGLAGCDDFPRDARSTLAEIRGGTRPLRVGWSVAEPWVRAGAAGEPAGVEPDLLRAWAEAVGARLAWVAGGAPQLVEALSAHAVDVALAGFAETQPWGARIGQTQAYLRSELVVGAVPGTLGPDDLDGVEIRHHRRRPQVAAAIRGAGGVPVPADGSALTPLAAAYGPELEPLGLTPIGRRLGRENRVIATAPGENALLLALDRFLLPRRAAIPAMLAAEARR